MQKNYHEAGDEMQPFLMKGVGKHTLVYGAGILLSKALSVVMLPVYTRYLTPADYGVMGLIQMTLDIAALIAGGQIAQGIFRFYHKAQDERGKLEVVSTALLGLGVSYLAVGAMAFLSAEFLSRVVFASAVHAHLIRLASAALGLEAFLLVPLAYARVRDRSLLFVGVSAGKLLLAASLNVLFIVGMGMGPAGVFTSTLITNTVVGLAFSAWLVSQVGMRPSASALRSLVRYGLPLVVTTIATFLATFGSRYFLQASDGEATVGIFNLAYEFGFLLAVVGYLPFHQVWGPKRFEIATRLDRDTILARGFLYANVLLLTTAVGIVLFVQPALQIMSDPGFHGAARFVPLILVAYIFQSWGHTQDIGILVRERTEFITLADWTAAAVAMTGYATLIPRYHSWGAAIAAVLAFSVRYGLTYRFSQRLWRVEYQWAPVLRLAALATAVSLAAIILPGMGILASVGVRVVLLALYLVGAWNLGVLAETERSSVRHALSRLLARRTRLRQPRMREHGAD